MAKDDENGIRSSPPWSAALEEYDFTVKHRPGKSQTHVDGLSRQPVDPPPPEDTLLQVRVLNDEGEARRITRELHTANPPQWPRVVETLPRPVYAQGRPPHLLGDRSELSPMSIGRRLRAPPEDDWHHTVSRPLGYAVNSHCGTAPSRSPP